LSATERAALPRARSTAPPHIAGDYPEWLDAHLAKVFGDDRVAEATAMASRAPLDLRVNTLKSSRDKVLPRLSHLGTEPTPWSPIGLRIESRRCAQPASMPRRTFIKGAIECRTRVRSWRPCCPRKTRRAGDRPCAGAGGKTLHWRR